MQKAYSQSKWVRWQKMSRSRFIHIRRYRKQSWNRPKFFTGPARIFIGRNADSFEEIPFCAWVLITIVLVAVNAQENPMPNSTATSPQLSWVNASNAKLERELIA